MTKIKSYTVNTEGDNVATAAYYGYHAYHADGVTAIEIKAKNAREAELIAKRIIGTYRKVYYAFE